MATPLTHPLLELRQLRYIVVAAETASFARAARQLHVQQTTLSKRILAVEQRVGIALFLRTRRGSTPTRAGLEFARAARRILEEVELLGRRAKAIANGEAGRLVVGLSTSLSAGNLRSTMQNFLARFPDVDIRIVETDFEALAQGIDARTIDVAIVAGALEGEQFRKRHLWPERLMVALPESHALASSERIYWQDLRDETFVFTRRDPGPDAGDLLRARLRDPGRYPRIALHDVTRENLLNMLPLGGYLSLVAETAVGAHYPGVVLREVHDHTGLAHVDFFAIWHEENDNPTLQRLFHIIAERHPGFDAA